MTIEEGGVRPAQDIYQAMQANDTWADATGRHRHGHWVGELVSSILLASELQEVRYVALSDATTEGSPQGYVFTDDFLIIVNVTPAHAPLEEADWTVHVRGLSSLRQLQVRASVGPFDTNMGGRNWPGSPSAVLQFEEEAPIRIPLGQTYNDLEREALVLTVRRLPRFLR
ncbi:MAG: hypothetical protein L6367_05665 [Cellulomonas sp.]|nr:hypothetical protein [Cellulomonas sp.]